MSRDKVVKALADIVNKKIDGNIGIEEIFATVIIFGALYFLHKMETLIILKIDLKPILQVVAICFLFFIAVKLYLS